MPTPYEPSHSLNAETRAAYKRFHAATGLIPAAKRDSDREDAALAQWRADPTKLTHGHIEDLACCYPELAEKAFAARAAARTPPSAPPAVTNPAPTRDARPRVLRKQAEAMARLAIEHAGATTHDGPACVDAIGTWFAEADKLTDRDIAQLEILSPVLAADACAARAGHEDKSSDEPITFAFFQKWVYRWCLPMLTLYSYRLKATDDRLTEAMRPLSSASVADGEGGIDAVEMRLHRDSRTGKVGIEAGYPPALVTKDRADRMAQRLAELEAHIEELKTRPSLRYDGPWIANRAYGAQTAVTWDGSVWIAMEDTSAKPGQPTAESRAWRLAVKRGKDGSK